jgi:hypothetical protein
MHTPPPLALGASIWLWLHRLGGPGLILLGLADNSAIPLPGSMDAAYVERIYGTAIIGWLARYYKPLLYALMVVAFLGVAGVAVYLLYRGARAARAGRKRDAPRRVLPPAAA